MKAITTVMKTVMAAGAMTLLCPAANASEGVEINHLGVNNTLVRVTGEGNYIMLPVQEANDDARVNVLVDGKIADGLHGALRPHPIQREKCHS